MFFQLPEVNLRKGVCLKCPEGKQIWTFEDREDSDIIDQVNEWRQHAMSSSHTSESDFEVIYVEYQDGKTDQQYVLRYEFGVFVVDVVFNEKLGIETGDILVNFNSTDVRRRKADYMSTTTDKIKPETICTATFIRPPFPQEYLDKGIKVQSTLQFMSSATYILLYFLPFFLNF